MKNEGDDHLDEVIRGTTIPKKQSPQVQTKDEQSKSSIVDRLEQRYQQEARDAFERISLTVPVSLYTKITKSIARINRGRKKRISMNQFLIDALGELLKEEKND